MMYIVKVGTKWIQEDLSSFGKKRTAYKFTLEEIRRILNVMSVEELGKTKIQNVQKHFFGAINKP